MNGESAPASPHHGLRLREATPADRPNLVEMINAAYSIEDFLEGTRTDEPRLAAVMVKGTMLVAEDEAGALAACVYLEPRGLRAYVGLLAVDPARQGLGLARLMMQAAEDRLRLAGCHAIDITVLSMRPELLPLYGRLGFVESGMEEDFHPTRALKPGVVCNGIVMSKQL